MGRRERRKSENEMREGGKTKGIRRKGRKREREREEVDEGATGRRPGEEMGVGEAVGLKRKGLGRGMG